MLLNHAWTFISAHSFYIFLYTYFCFGLCMLTTMFYHASDTEYAIRIPWMHKELPYPWEYLGICLINCIIFLAAPLVIAYQAAINIVSYTKDVSSIRHNREIQKALRPNE